jgi:hypothetical protein
MPRDRRPAAVLVVAILNIFFGGMNLLSFVCAIPLLVVVFAILPPMPGSDKSIIKELFDSLNERIPFLAIMIGASIYALIVNTALLVSGIGLWKMRVWARRTAIACSVIQLVWVVGYSIIQFLWLNPAMADWQEHFNQKFAKPNAPPPPALFWTGFYNAGAVFGIVMGSFYPIAVLIILFLPHVRAAFAGFRSSTSVNEDDLPEVLDASAPSSEPPD